MKKLESLGICDHRCYHSASRRSGICLVRYVQIYRCFPSGLDSSTVIYDIYHGYGIFLYRMFDCRYDGKKMSVRRSTSFFQEFYFWQDL